MKPAVLAQPNRRLLHTFLGCMEADEVGNEMVYNQRKKGEEWPKFCFWMMTFQRCS